MLLHVIRTIILCSTPFHAYYYPLYDWLTTLRTNFTLKNCPKAPIPAIPIRKIGLYNLRPAMRYLKPG